MKQITLFYALILFTCISCENQPQSNSENAENSPAYYERYEDLAESLNFQLLPSEETGVDFVNKFNETEDFNYLYYITPVQND